MTTPTPTPSASDALQKARELAEKRPEPSKATEPFYTLEFFNSVWEHFPSIHAELEKVTVERDVALKGYREMREALKFYKKLDDEMLRFNRGLLAKKDMEDIDGVAHKALTSFPEIK